jgi:hypothetical protein
MPTRLAALSVVVFTVWLITTNNGRVLRTFLSMKNAKLAHGLGPENFFPKPFDAAEKSYIIKS